MVLKNGLRYKTEMKHKSIFQAMMIAMVFFSGLCMAYDTGCSYDEKIGQKRYFSCDAINAYGGIQLDFSSLKAIQNGIIAYLGDKNMGKENFMEACQRYVAQAENTVFWIQKAKEEFSKLNNKNRYLPDYDQKNIFPYGEIFSRQLEGLLHRNYRDRINNTGRWYAYGYQRAQHCFN